MIRHLAQCPYCNGCEIALDDHPELVFNPATDTRAPCPHLAWVDGRYSQWDHPAHGADQMIGSVEFRHDSEERTNELLPYLHELLEAGRAGLSARPSPTSFGASARRKKPPTPGARALRSGMWTAGPSLPGTRPGSGGSCRPARNASWPLSKSMKEKRREDRAGEIGTVPVSPRTVIPRQWCRASRWGCRYSGR